MASVTVVEVKKLKYAKYNPASRVSSDINPLIKSIQRVGLLVPVLATKSLDLIDGHRRVAAYKKLGINEIPVIFTEGDAAELFSEVNTQNRRLTGNQMLEVYLAEPKAISNQSRGRFEEAEEVLGRVLLERMNKEGLSLATYAVAKRLLNEADKFTEEMMKKTVRWMLKFNSSGLVRRAMAGGTPVGMIIAGIEKDKAIRPKYVVS